METYRKGLSAEEYPAADSPLLVFDWTGEKMKALFAAMMQDGPVAKIGQCFAKKHAQSFVYGLAGSQKHAVFAASLDAAPRTTVIITHNHEALEEWKTDLSALLPAAMVVELPELDLMTFSAAAKSVSLSAERMDVLGRLMRKEPIVVLAKASAAVQKGISKQEFERLSMNLKLGDTIERDDLLERLVHLGYEHAEQVDGIGQFSARGGIVDVFPINALVPIRIEFFDDEIDSLREFDLDSQRSLRNISVLSILPLAQTDDTGKPELFLSYLEGEGVVIFDEPTRIREQILKILKENPEIRKKIFGWEDIIEAAAQNNVIYMALMLQKIHNAEPDELVSVVAKSVAPFQRQMDMLASDVRSWLEQKEQILVLMGDEQKAASMREVFARYRLPSSYEKRDIPALSSKLVTVAQGSLLNGFELPGAKLVVIAEKDVLGRQKK